MNFVQFWTWFLTKDFLCVTMCQNGSECAKFPSSSVKTKVPNAVQNYSKRIKSAIGQSKTVLNELN